MFDKGLHLVIYDPRTVPLQAYHGTGFPFVYDGTDVDFRDITEYIAPASAVLEERINERSSFSCTLRANPAALGALRGTPYVVYRYGEAIAGGLIDSVTEQRAGGMVADVVEYQLTCSDWHELLDRRIVAETYIDKTVREIVDDLLAKYLTAEGIVLAEISPEIAGATVTEAAFNYVPATRVFDNIAEHTGAAWWIDAGKGLHIASRGTYAAPWALNGTARVRNVTVRKHREEYRNRQYIRGGRDITVEQVESFKGDGEAQTFNVAYPIAEAPQVSVNGMPKTVGIRGVDDGKDWYWNKDDTAISQDRSGTPLTASDTLTVTYRGFFEVVAIVADQNEIDARAEVEGGTGRYEHVTEEKGITSLNAAIDAAVNKLKRYAAFGETITFETLEGGLRAGQLLTIDLPEHKLSGEYLITSVTLQAQTGLTDYEGKEGNYYTWQVEAVSGDAVGGWGKFFRDLFDQIRAFQFRENVNENDVVIILAQFEKAWQEEDDPNPFYELYPSEDVFPEEDLYPMFGDKYRFRYLAWCYDGVELGRTRLVNEIYDRDNGTVITVHNIRPHEGVGAIDELRWYGDVSATSEPESGVLMDSQEFVRDKTNIEQIQVIRIDTKGW